MTRFFVDAFYWIALLSPRDQWHARVRAFNAALAAYHLYTTDEVLTEFLAFYSATDPLLRTRAVGGAKSQHIQGDGEGGIRPASPCPAQEPQHVHILISSPLRTTFTGKEMTRPGKYRIILYSVYISMA